MSVAVLKDHIYRITDLRKRALEKIFRLQHLPKENSAQEIRHLSRICILASSSRGGSSVTAELLQWQGADCADATARLLTLPGEEKPHIVLSALAFPAREEQFDDLTAADALTEQAVLLLEELRSEIGYPMAYCAEPELYAIQLYRRLLLQWPLLLGSIEPEESIERLTNELRITFPGGYRDSQENRREALSACIRCFPFIRPDFYDCWLTHEDTGVVTMAQAPWSFEETPFIFPPPWHNATVNDIETGTLLLRDPSNAWRLPFWRQLFEKQVINILHLVRDPRESVQGLCDGWNYPYGFQTITSSHDMVIPGYTDGPDTENAAWKNRRLNFSICKSLSQKILEEKAPLSLVDICAYQWKDAHEKIMQVSEQLDIARTVIHFTDLRLHTGDTFRKICNSFQLEISQSGLDYVQSFPERWVMVTPQARQSWHGRWATSCFGNEIKELHASGYFDELTESLGLLKVSAAKKAYNA